MWPNDDTGNVLADMADAGIDLSITHDVVFFQLFEDKKQAQAMAEFITQEYADMNVNVHADEIPNVWDLDCTVKMVPSYDAIIEQEQVFEQIAAKYNGYNDGWGIEA
jgi:hypothetical protein